MTFNPTYTVTFILNFAICYFAMKLWSWNVTPRIKRKAWGHFWKSPYLTANARPFRHGNGYFRGFFPLIFLIASIFGNIWLIRTYLMPLNYWKTLLICPTIYLIAEALGHMGFTIFPTTNLNTQLMHENPLVSKSISEFWGRRWNIWVQDWLNDVASSMKQLSKNQRMFVIFLISGFFHEMMVALPYWIVFRESYFGLMFAYFTIQFAGVWVDKKLLRNTGIIRRIFMWAVVIFPSPLFINQPLRAFIGL